MRPDVTTGFMRLIVSRKNNNVVMCGLGNYEVSLFFRV